MPGLGGGSGKPKPFVKDAISISENVGTKKRWVHADPVRLVPGEDIVRGLGLVTHKQWMDHPVRGVTDIKLTFKNGKKIRYASGDKVIAFTEAEGDPVG